MTSAIKVVGGVMTIARFRCLADRIGTGELSPPMANSATSFSNLRSGGASRS